MSIPFDDGYARLPVSVCSGGSGAVYRYGTPGKVELTSRNLTFSNCSHSGGGESQLTAKNGDYTCTVYDRTVRTSFGEGGNDPEFSSGWWSRAQDAWSRPRCAKASRR